MDNLSDLRLFVRVALTESFAAAARIEGMTSSAVSKAVQRVEAEVGAKLFSRTTRSVALTVEGERLLEGARKLLDEAESLKSEFTDSLDEPRGKLVISASAVFGRLWLTRRALSFMCRYKHVEVELRFEDRIVDLASEGIDVAIRIGTLGDSANLVARKLFSDVIHTVAAPSYIERYGHPQRITDLEGHRGIHYRAQNTGRLFPFLFECEGNPIRRTLDPVLVANDIDAIHQATEAGLGIAQLPTYLILDSLAQNRLVKVMEDVRVDSFPYSIVYLDRRLVAPRVRAFVDFLVSNPPSF
ncbi:LysR family transcriptional regulator [Ruegeria sp. ANG10]|uniref:LysR family transcriptional regulator n=1 Tax=Ruegeria sp. ANG10 TaxID=3042467 RepID=UPI0034517783